MKWQTFNEESHTDNPSKPFLILPLIEINQHKIDEAMTKKKPNLRLFTKTWPLRKNENKGKSDDRPLTATLEKPQILDIKFIGKIDMSLVRKEFLCITNLCRAPLTITKVVKKPSTNNRRRNVTSRPLSLPSCDERLRVNRRIKRPETSEDSWEDEESGVSQAQSARSSSKISKMNAKKITPPLPLTGKRQIMKRFDKKLASDPNNNQKLNKIVQKRKENDNTTVEGKKCIPQSTKLPQPCKTCGRSDQPERFHSHPATPLKPVRKMDEVVKIPSKSTVQKPFAIKYKSKVSDNKPSLIQKATLPAQQLIHSPPPCDGRGQVQGDSPRTGRGPRTLMCYLCGREFGTASLPLHEPKCLEKWERENASLPPNMRRKPPKKPEIPMTAQQWNEHAWEACQASLAPCENCGRTFLPDRLLVHQRSCKPQRGMEVVWESENLLQLNTDDVAGPSGATVELQGINWGRYKPPHLQTPLASELQKMQGKTCNSNWDEVDFSLFFTYSCVAHMLGCAFALAFFSKFLKWDDALLGLISSVSKICGCIVYAFAPNSLVFYIGTLIEVFNGTAFIAMRSIISKLVSGDELGKMNSMFGMSEALMPFIYGPMYSALYRATIKTFPGAFYLLGSVLTIPAVLIFIWLYLNRTTKRIEEDKDFDKKESLLVSNNKSVEEKM